MGRTRAGWVAWSVAVLTLASHSAYIVVGLRHTGRLPDHLGAFYLFARASLVAAAFPVVGAVIVVKQPRNVIGWILVALGGAATLENLARLYAVYGLYLRPGAVAGPQYAAWWATWQWVPALLPPLIFVPLLFPYGRLPSPRWKPAAVALGAGIVVTAAGMALRPGPLDDFPDLVNPFGVPWGDVLAAPILLAPAGIGIGFASVLVRRRRAVGDEREQLRWLLYALGLAAAGTAGLLVTWEWGPLAAVFTLGPFLLLPVAIGVAIVKYHLYDIDVIINRTLVYGGLTAAVLGTYGLIVLAASRALGAQPQWRWSVLVVAAVAILAYPLREWLQGLVNRLMYGYRDNPGEAMSRLARRLADTITPAALLPAVAETIGLALRLPYVAVELPGHGAAPVAGYGSLRGAAHRIALTHQGVPVGALVIGRRSPNEQFSPADLRVLDDVARQVAVAAHAVRLTEDLQRSRERLVLAREEERRRLRRDLHDGLGSALAGLGLYAGNARRCLAGEPDAAAEWIGRLEEGIRAAVLDVRRLVDDLRPPTLDELGLVASLRRQAAALPLPLTVVSPRELPPLPAAVEVAAYRIAVEAMVNAARHAHASHAEVRLSLDDAGALCVRVRDDGSGIPAQPRAGLGLTSMRERAAELGGRCDAGPAEPHGTVVRAVLPLASEQGGADGRGTVAGADRR